ncbi:LOW QUALITY PROTEIN: hypothetical protein YC2023_020566 [Brassica napus]
MDKKMSARSSSDHLSPPSPVVAVAINGNKKSKDVAYWALEKFIPGGFSDFKLIYVRPPITYIITPSKSSPESCSYCKISMCLWGKRYLYLAISAEAVSAYRKEVDGNTNELLRPYKQMFESRKVRVEILVLESHDPVAAIAEEIAGTGVTKLVIGMSHPGFFAKKIGMSSMIATARNDKVRKNGERQFHECLSDPDSPSPRAPSSNNREIPNMDWGAVVPANYSFVSHQASNMSEGHLSLHSMTDNNQLTVLILDSIFSRDLRARVSSHLITLHWFLFATEATSCVDSRNDINLDGEGESRAETCSEMYAMAQTETVDASQKLTELNQRKYEESEKLMELKEKEELAKDTASKEKQRYEDTMKEAEKVKELMMKEALRRREAEIKAERDAKEKDELQASLVCPGIQYQYYSWD